MVLSIILASLLTVAVGIITYYKWSYQYWRNRYVPVVATASFPFGCLKNPFTTDQHAAIHIKQIHGDLKARNHKYGGFYVFTTPAFLPVDPQVIKSIFQQDFQYFIDRGFYYNEKDDPLSANLFALGGERWRTLRAKMTSAFTPVKIKTMFDILLQCGDQMHQALVKVCEKRQPIDIRDVSACYTIDIIGSCGFGIECNSFKYPDAEFRKYAKSIFAPKHKLELAVIGFAFAFENVGRWLGIKLFKKETTEFFINVVRDAIEMRDTQKIVRNDMLQLLIELRDQPSDSGLETKGLTLNELAAQVFIFFAAGFETSSTTMTFCLYELAINPYLQQKVRDELNEVLANHKGEVTYEAVMELKYMGQVVDETLRKYPPLSCISRRCVKDYKIPNTDVVLRKGENCVISILGLHHDPSYYPDPEKFDPERFSAENKHKRQPFTYMPFGEGPRICIGLRLGLLQLKVGLAFLLKNYRFSLNEKTSLPIKFDPFVFTMVPATEMFLNIERIDN